MAENKKVMEEEAVDTKETKAEQTCEETKDTKETAAEETKETAAEEKDTKKEEKSEKKGAFGKKKKDKKDEQIEDLNDRLKRQMAEFDNFRKRTEKEKRRCLTWEQEQSLKRFSRLSTISSVGLQLYQRNKRMMLLLSVWIKYISRC